MISSKGIEVRRKRDKFQKKMIEEKNVILLILFNHKV